MRIAQVELVPYAIALREPLVTTFGAITRRRGAIIRLVVDGPAGGSGEEGLGDFSPHPAASDLSIRVAWRAASRAALDLRGADVSRIDEVLRAARRLPPSAAMALDLALVDLKARIEGRRLCDTLGGARRDSVATSHLLGADPESDARRALDSGYTAMKLKADGQVDTTVRRVREVLRVAPGVALRVDVNGAWSVRQALRAASLLSGAVEWLEQPVAPEDVAGLACVRRAGHLKVAADECVTDVGSIEDLERHGAADVVVIKLVQVGGWSRAIEVAAAARRAGMGVTVTTAIDSGLAAAAALHLALALPEPMIACGVATGNCLTGDVVIDPVADGPRMAPPPGPGLGVRLDRAALARFRTEQP